MFDPRSPNAPKPAPGHVWERVTKLGWRSTKTPGELAKLGFRTLEVHDPNA